MSRHYLTGKRIICQGIIVDSTYNLATEPRERIVLEVSPSGEWIKLANERGVSSWEKMAEVNVIEILGGSQ